MIWSYNQPYSFILTVLCILLTLQVSLSQSGCERCASSGDCSQAFHYGPGKFCGDFRDFATNKPCCCPNNSQCQVTPTTCNCYIDNSSYHNSGYHRGYDYNNYSSGQDAFGSIITMLILICFCMCCCRGCFGSYRRSNVVTGEYIPIAVPYNGNDENPPPTAPDYQSTSRSTPSPGWGSGRRESGFAWGPALGGFILGEMLGSRGNDNGHSRNRRGTGLFGGGVSIPGDSSGGGFGGGFSIPGDSGGRGGGGGFTIRGDS